MSQHGYLHFRCQRHQVSGAHAEGKEATYRCGVAGCQQPAKSYWYRGPQFERLSVPASLTIEYGSGIDGMSYDC